MALVTLPGPGLRPPLPQPATLDRGRLGQIIEDSVSRHPVTVISAPNGFGKTTAVAEWADSTDREIVWIALGPQTDRARIDSRLRAALAALLDTPEPLTRTDALLESIARHPRKIAVVVDDAHRAHKSLATGVLAALLDEPDLPFRLVLVGTPQLELHMPRFLLTRPHSAIGAGDLAFDAEEVARLGREMSSGADAAAVFADTAGWPIAVRTLLDDTPAAADTRALLHDYVRDVVLAGLPSDVGRFVLEAVSIDALTPAFAARLTERSDAPGLLDQCRRLGLLVERDEGRDGAVYRWHPLFARHCRDLLAEADPDRSLALRRRAADLLTDTEPLTTIRILLEIGDVDAAQHALLRAWPVVLVAGSPLDLLAVLREFPAGVLRTPSFLEIRACVADFEGDHDRSRTLAREADAADASGDGAFASTRALARVILADDRSELRAATDAARALMAREDLGARQTAALSFLIGWAELRRRSDPVRMVEALETAVRSAGAAGEIALERRATECLAYALAWSGRLRQASAVLDRVAASEGADAGGSAHLAGVAGLAAGVVAYWRSDLAASERELRGVFAFTRGRRVAADVARVMLACTAAATGDARLCRRAAFELQFLPRAEVHGVEWVQLRQVASAVLEEAVGHGDRALVLARSLLEETLMPALAVLVAGILRRAGDYAAAAQLLRAHSDYRDISYLRVASLVTAATRAWDAGDTDLAHRRCEEALMIADDEGIRVLFTDADPVLHDLLGAHVRWSTRHEEFLTSCLRQSRTAGLSALSQRERDVFEQLRTTLTTTEIAARLGVSVNTVKTHQQAIYRKLEVTSRREALRRYT